MLALRSQFLYTKFDSEMIAILRMRFGPMAMRSNKYSVKVWAEGKSRRINGPTIESVIERLHGVRFNELTDLSTAKTPFVWKPGLTVTMVSSVLKVSPTSLMWAPVQEDSLASPEHDRNRRSLKSLENSLKYHDVGACPSVFESASFIDNERQWDVENLTAELYHDSQHIDFREGELGFIDLADPPVWNMCLNMWLALAPNPKTFQSLGAKIDALHNVIIGPTDMCRGLGEVIPRSVIRPIGRSGKFEWLEIPEKALTSVEVARNVSSWLVHSDSYR